jgi:hypothetical protein
MERVLLLGLRKEKTVGCCNIARAARSSNKIAAIGEQKFPAVVKGQSHVLSCQKKIDADQVLLYEVTYRVIVRPLGQRFTGLVIEAIDPRPVVGKIVNAA